MSALRQIADGVWDTESDQFLPGRLHWRARTTIVRLEDGSLWLHSPVPLDDEVAAAIGALGTVAHIVAPSRFHHVHVSPAAERFPEARIYGAPGLDDKRKDLEFSEMLGSEAPEAWRGQIDQVVIDGAPGVSEVVFFHRASRTLVVTDLLFNIQEVKNFQSRWVLRMVGAYRRFTQSLSWRWVFTKDRQAARESVQRLLQWDFERVLVGHGEIVDQDAQARTRAGLRWMLGE